MKTNARPGRALAHPLWITALFFLVLNDHVLKGAGLLPTAVTGKLSDVAGLLVAPWLLAILVRARRRPALFAAHAAGGVGFAAINVWPLAARAVELATATTPIPWHITVDASDLLALPALALSWIVLLPVAESARYDLARAVPRVARGAVFAVGLLACVATSRWPDWAPSGVIAVADATQQAMEADPDETRTFRVLGLRADVQLDCETVAEDPSRMLSRDQFEPFEVWELFGGRALGLTVDETRGCSAWIVQPDGAPAAFFFWLNQDRGNTALPGTARGMAEDDGAMLVFGDGLVRRWTDHPFRFPMPRDEDEEDAATCGLLEPGNTLAWDPWAPGSPQGTWLLTELRSSPDGCHRLQLSGLENSAATASFFVCTAGVPLPFAAGEPLTIERPLLGAETEELRLVGTELALTLARGPDALSELEGRFVFEDVPNCGGVSDSCGNYLRPLRIVIDDEDTIGEGKSIELAEGRTLHLVRAAYAAVVDSACVGGPTRPSTWVETVTVDVTP